MNFGMATPRASQPVQGRQAMVQALATPQENATLQVFNNGICNALIPYGTPKAGSIRAYMAARMLNDANQRLFIFRKETNNAWTTIASDSTASLPKLTAPPSYVVSKWSTTMTACPVR